MSVDLRLQKIYSAAHLAKARVSAREAACATGGMRGMGCIRRAWRITLETSRTIGLMEM